MASTSDTQPNSWRSFLSRLLHRESSLGYIMLGPGLLFLLIMMAYPFGYAVYLGFTDKQIGAPAHFIGLENYTRLLQTTLFAKTVTNRSVSPDALPPVRRTVLFAPQVGKA